MSNLKPGVVPGSRVRDTHMNVSRMQINRTVEHAVDRQFLFNEPDPNDGGAQTQFVQLMNAPVTYLDIKDSGTIADAMVLKTVDVNGDIVPEGTTVALINTHPSSGANARNFYFKIENKSNVFSANPGDSTFRLPRGRTDFTMVYHRDPGSVNISFLWVPNNTLLDVV